MRCGGCRHPALRPSYLTFPWPRLSEEAVNNATLNIDRQVADERVVLYAHIPSPESRTLQDLGAIIHPHQYGPVDSIPSYHRAAPLSHVPPSR